MTAKARRDGSGSSRLDHRRRSANQASNESYLARKREIIQAAVRLVSKNGYEATNLDDIARAVDMDRATLYYYFKSKTQLLGTAMIDALAAEVTELNHIAASNMDALSKLRAATKCIVTAMAEKYPFSALYYQDDIRRSPRNAEWIAPLRKNDKRIAEIFQAIVEEGQSDGTIREDVPADLINRIISGSIGWSYRWLKPGGAHSLDEVNNAFDAVLSAGVVPPMRSPRRTHRR